MPKLFAPKPTKHSTVLPGGRILDRIMRLLVASVAAGLIYGLFTHATKSACADNPATGGTSCLELELNPSGWVYLLMALTAIVLLSRAIQNSPNEATAVHLIRWAGMIVPLIAVAALVISMTSLMLTPTDGWAPGDSFTYVVPFGSVDLEITHNTAEP